jgi:hypothetical protein
LRRPASGGIAGGDRQAVAARPQDEVRGARAEAALVAAGDAVEIERRHGDAAGAARAAALRRRRDAQTSPAHAATFAGDHDTDPGGFGEVERPA